MNIRTVIFSGVMTALIGAMIGLAVSHIAGKDSRHKPIMFGGAILGLVVGAGQESIRQQCRLREREIEGQNQTENKSL